MNATSDEARGARRRRLARRALAFALAVLALAAPPALAGPAAGTLIQNTATGAGSAGGSPVTASSNVVTVTVGAPVAPPPPLPPPLPTTGVALAANGGATTTAGRTVYLPHVLTNTGSVADSFTLVASDAGGAFAFASIAIYADADVDGRPDGAAALAGPVALAAGASMHFVVALAVPADAPARRSARALVRAVGAAAGDAASNTDTVSTIEQGVLDCALVYKSLSPTRGASPGGPVTVRLSYSPCDKARSRLRVRDLLPAGMTYVPGSGRWSGTGAAALTDDVQGDDRQGGGTTQVAYDFGVSERGAVTANVYDLAAGAGGALTFQVTIDAGLAVDTVIANTAAYVFYDPSGTYLGEHLTEPATYQVTGSVDVVLTGERLPVAQPGATASFTNVLTNRGSLAERFDITVGSSTFPDGTAFALFQPDGVTPLADTDGNGTPDTGLLAPGASYRIVLKARIPATAAPGAYKVTKTATAASAPMLGASADDAVDTIASKCAVVLDPDQQARVGLGQHVTYVHYLTNRGNCSEAVQAMVDYLGDSEAAKGWTSSAYLDHLVSGGGSLPGAVDPTDTPVRAGWTRTLAPGESLRVLVDVTAPAEMKSAAAKQAVASNMTTLVLTGTGSGALTVRDTTLVEDDPGAIGPDDAIRNFTDERYAVPTIWAVIGGNLWLRADASSCNASAAAVESRTVVITGPGGERETAAAVETDPASGVFLVPALAVRPAPAVAGDGVLQGNAGDVFDVSLEGCGRTIRTVVTLMAPTSVVFDSRSNAPVSGALVTLVNASGPQCSATAADVPGQSRDHRRRRRVRLPRHRLGYLLPRGARAQRLRVPLAGGVVRASRGPQHRRDRPHARRLLRRPVLRRGGRARGGGRAGRREAAGRPVRAEGRLAHGGRGGRLRGLRGARAQRHGQRAGRRRRHHDRRPAGGLRLHARDRAA